MSSKEIIYILGAGRSGSTILATVLNSSSEIKHVGELHHFVSYLKNDDQCSCGIQMSSCSYWGAIVEKFADMYHHAYEEKEQLCNEMEYHTAIPFYLAGQIKEKKFDEYEQLQKNIIHAVSEQEGATKYILDSAKYIGRFLALRKIFNNQLKGIYLVRDVRGVIWSFNKRVQTQSPPLRTIIYYIYINFWAQLLVVLLPEEQILKIRYEDIVNQPQETFEKIGEYVGLDLSDTASKIEMKERFQIPHIVGGNRLKKSDFMTFKKDTEWQEKMPVFQKIVYYLTALPLMMINRYKIL